MCVEREEKGAQNTTLWRTGAEGQGEERWGPSLTDCGWSVKMSLIHWQMGEERPRCRRFCTRISGMI